MSSNKSIILAVIAFVFLIGVPTLFGGFFTVDQSSKAVVIRWGQITESVDPGFHLKMPWVDSVKDYSLQPRTYRYTKINSYSQDQQPADLDMSVIVHINPVMIKELYANFGDLDTAVQRLVVPHLLQEAKVVFGQYTAVTTVQNRTKLNVDIYNAINAQLVTHPEIIFDSFQLENVDFSPEYVKAVEARMQAEVEVQKLQQQQQQTEIKAKMTVIENQALADSQLAIATASAKATNLKADAEAHAITVRGQALKDNPNLVDLTVAERWDGKLPATMVPGNALPMLNLPQH